MRLLNYFFLMVLVSVFVSCDNKEKTPVEKNGQLKIDGTRIVSENGEIVQLAGMSFFWSQWIDKYYNYECVKWLRDDWNCSIVRAAIAAEHSGYVNNPAAEMAKAETIIEAAIDLGLYVIVDFHSHRAELFESEAMTFFGQIAKKYGNRPNVIYEIYNEPLNVSWSEDIKPYSEAVIAEIRKYDPDNIIVCGTPRWSQLVNEAANDPVDAQNIAYTLHFYAGTHGKELREIGDEAISKGLCLFVTEYGTTEANGDGPVFENETQEWYNWMNAHNISHCNWSVADKNESSAALVENADPKGGWTEDQIKPSGKIVRKELMNNYVKFYK